MCDFFCNLSTVKKERDDFEKEIEKIKKENESAKSDLEKIDCGNDEDMIICPSDKILDVTKSTIRAATEDVCCIPKATCETMTNNACGSGKIKDSSKDDDTCAGKICNDSDISTCCKDDPSAVADDSATDSADSADSSENTSPSTSDQSSGDPASCTTLIESCLAPFQIKDPSTVCESSPCATTDLTRCCVTPPKCSSPQPPGLSCSPRPLKDNASDIYCLDLTCSSTPSKDECCSPAPSVQNFIGSIYFKKQKGNTCFRYFLSLFIILLIFIILRHVYH